MIYKLCRDNYFPKRMEEGVIYVWGYKWNRRMCSIDRTYQLPDHD